MIFCYTHRSVPYPPSPERLPPGTNGNMCRDEQSDVRERGERKRESKWEVSIKSLHSELRESCRRGGRKIVRARGDGGHQEKKPSESTKQGAYKLTETEAASTEPTWVYTSSSAYVLAWYLYEIPDRENNWVSDSHACSWDSSPVGLLCTALI